MLMANSVIAAHRASGLKVSEQLSKLISG